MEEPGGQSGQNGPVARLIYSAIASLDGYVEDESGGFEWAAPDEQVHAFVNDLERPVGTYLYGRRMYETMAFWETDEASAEGQPAEVRDFAAIWRAAEKVVFSRSLEQVSSERTRIERSCGSRPPRDEGGRAARPTSAGAAPAGRPRGPGSATSFISPSRPPLAGGPRGAAGSPGGGRRGSTSWATKGAFVPPPSPPPGACGPEPPGKPPEPPRAHRRAR